MLGAREDLALDLRRGAGRSSPNSPPPGPSGRGAARDAPSRPAAPRDRRC
ncbi:MAG: hypothetical protein MZV63_19910 [Marinilabiliales bacterium]|nr:hypothetical protein [Marinilabiliales bacterium]